MADCKISVVIPAYNVEKYLRKCLKSVVSQTFGAYEVIIVNDGSTDTTSEIIKEYKMAYPNLITVYETENKGVSHARNYGVNRAKGEYVLFVDSDDFIELTMCEKLYLRASEDKADIVVCDRYDFFEDEKTGTVKRKKSTGFYMPFGRVIDLRRSKFELSHLSPFPWDKLYRIELVKQFPFPEGIRFEDLAVMYQILISANRISVIEDYLYNYRRTTSGGFLNTFSEETKDIVKACKKIVSDFKENEWYDAYYEELEYILAMHLLLRYNVLFDADQKGKLKLKKELIHETQSFLDDQFPDWRNNRYLKYSTGKIMRDKFSHYQHKRKMLRQAVYREYIPGPLLRIATKINKTIIKIGTGLKRFIKSKDKKSAIKKVLPFLKVFDQPASTRYTKLYEKLSVSDNLVLFESKHGEDIAGNIFYLLLAMSGERYQRFQIQLVLKKAYRETYSNLLKRYDMDYVQIIGMETTEYFTALASAKYLITDTSLPPYYIKRTEQVYLNTWHGTPLKAMGRVVPKREYALGNVQRNFYIADYLLYQNEFSRDVFLSDYMLNNIYSNKIMISGYPRNSAFFNKESRAKIRSTFEAEDKQIIAYLPTWRGLLDKKESKKQIQVITDYLLEIDKQLKEMQEFYVKLHPFVKAGINYDQFHHIKPFPEEFETYDFLNATDVLVTDYSSIMFDYAASGRGIVLFTYDREEYLNDRGMYLDLEQMEFTKADTVDKLMESIEKPADYKKFREEYCPFDSADTAGLVVDQLFFNGNEFRSEQCLNLGVNGRYKVESLEQSGKKRALIFLGGLGKGEKTKKFIEELNALDTKSCDYYLCMKSDSVKASTSMISEIKKEIGYFPISFEVNTTRREKAALALHLRFGIKTVRINKKVTKIANRERMKYFGNLSFDYIINYSVKDKLLHRICGTFQTEKILNLQELNIEKYKKNKQYRTSIRYLLTNANGFKKVILPPEAREDGLPISKDIIVQKSNGSGIDKMLEV